MSPRLLRLMTLRYAPADPQDFVHSHIATARYWAR